MRKRILFLTQVLILGSVLECIAQKENNIWCFGHHGGVSFNSGAPVPFQGVLIDQTEGCSSIADSSGNLLFYTDGVKVWNRNHGVMPNGTGLGGGNSSSQSALIIKQPGSDSLYYIFTTSTQTLTPGFCYSIVNISLQGGYGDVIVKNRQLFWPSVEKISATYHQNKDDIWVVGHEWGTNAFRSYLLSASGLDTVPLISNCGAVHYSSSDPQVSQGCMKISSDGRYLALAIGGVFFHPIEIFLFDNLTGSLSFFMQFSLLGTPYGIEFSPRNSKLYVSSAGSGLYQYDLSSGDTALIYASEYYLSPSKWAIQLATDGKIYCDSFPEYLNVINYPELSGLACNYQSYGVHLDPNTCIIGLPEFLYRSDFFTSLSHEIVSELSFFLYPNPAHYTFTISLNELKAETAKLKMYDMTGRIVCEQKISSQLSTFNFQLAAGIYLVRVEAGEKVWQEKVVVE